MEALLRDDCGYSEISKDILSRCRGWELFSLSLVSKGIRETVLKQWDVKKAFSPHFKDVQELFRILKICNAIISGSSALGFFDGTGSSLSGDVDIYTYMPFSEPLNFQTRERQMELLPHMNRIMSIGFHLIEKEGYKFVPHNEGPYSPYYPPKQPLTGIEAFKYEMLFGKNDDCAYAEQWSITRVFTFERPSDDKKVQIVGTSVDKHWTLLSFHSTVVCNMITPTHAISVFPKTTFKKRQIDLLNFNPDFNDISSRNSTWEGVDKYIERGWNINKNRTVKRAYDWNNDTNANANDIMEGYNAHNAFISRIHNGVLGKDIGDFTMVPETSLAKYRSFCDKDCWMIPLNLTTGEGDERAVRAEIAGEFKWTEAEFKDHGRYTFVEVDESKAYYTNDNGQEVHGYSVESDDPRYKFESQEAKGLYVLELPKNFPCSDR